MANAVVNSASYLEGPIALGSIFTVFGYSLGPLDLVQAGSYPLPTLLSGTSIKITAGSTSFNCPMIYTSYSQLSAILPSNAPIGDATLMVTYNGVTGTFFPAHITIVSSSFGIYSVGSSGIGPGIITGVDYVVKPLDQPARPGEVVIAWGTGLGPTEGSDANQPTSTKQFPNVEVFIANTPAAVTYAGRSGCCAGLDQIAFQIPNTTLGCFVPVIVRTGGATVSNFVSVPISAFGQACSIDPPGLPAQLLSRALAGDQLKVGIIAVGPLKFLEFFGFSFSQNALDQLSALLHGPVSSADVKRLIQAYRARQMLTVRQLLAKYGIDVKHIDRRLVRAVRAAAGLDQQGVGANFGTFSALSAFSPQFASNVPPVGTCTVTREVQPPRFQVQSKSLDAGSVLTFNGPAGQRVMSRQSTGYQASLGGGFPDTKVPVGAYSVAGSGGTAVGQFTARLNISSVLTWSNKSAIGSVDRKVPLTVTWTGGAGSGYVLIGAVAESNGAAGALLCVENSQKGSFTIPSFALSALPGATSASAYLFVAPHPFSNPVTIPGVDLAYFINGSADYKPMEFR
jgi:uncharacterized protein (TIGR03437 family)